jgi:glycosyltransferase involved in cell wall biosynthesis
MSPLKLFESLASGTPIICSNIKVLREILKDNYNSILVKNFEDKNEWVSKIKKIQKNTKKLKFLSNNALSTSKNYTWSKRTRIFLDMYK